MNALQFATPPPASPAAIDAIFPRVLMAIDFGSASLGAARWGTSHIAPDRETLLMHVMPFDDAASSADAPEATNDPTRHMVPAIVGGLGGFGAMLDVASARSIVRVGRPSSCLASVANDTETSLLVLGRRTDANRIRIGEPNVIERVARRTSASVLVVPEGTTAGPDHIVAAVDESRSAPQVLRVAGRLARMHEVPLTVLHVFSPSVGAYERVIRSAKQLVSGSRGHGPKASDRQRTPVSLPSETTRWLMQLSHAHHVIGRDSTEIAMGDPAREIVRIATARDAPLVVVGMRGADEAPVGSIGSVARELLTRAPVPVLAVNAI
jgi:nucleotide-binding universal stress UspA family protein